MHERNLAQMFFGRVKQHGKRARYRHVVDGQWVEVSWQTMGERVRQCAAGLLELGLRRGERVALLSSSRAAWCEADFGIMAAGGITVPIYPSSPASDCGYVLWNADVGIAIVENAQQLEKIQEVMRDGLVMPEGVEHEEGAPRPGDRVQLNVRRIIVIDPLPNGREETSFEELLQLGRGARAIRQDELHATLNEVGPGDTATIVYTSGTTGPPKGVVQTHGNHLAMCRMISEETGVFAEGDVDFLFLPLAHSFARLQEFVGIYCGTTTSFARSLETIVEDLKEARPQVMPAVPRVYEKIHARVLGQAQASRVKHAVFRWALGVGKRVSGFRRSRRRLPLFTAIQARAAHALVFRKLHEIVGGRMKYFVSGGAPLSPEVAEFFHAAGLLILEGYGLTETCPALCINRPHEYRFGTVGKPLPGVELRVAPDGELLAKGPNVTREYFKRPLATAEAWDEEGWFHTGDVVEIEADGFVRITDRKKELIVTAGGKNISPQNVENVIKTSPYISQAMLVGDGKPYCVALVTISDQVQAWAKRQGKGALPLSELVHDPQVHELIAAEIEQRNASLARYETVKAFRIAWPDFSQDTGELTPSLKLKRRVILERHGDLVRQMYAGPTRHNRSRAA